MKEPLHLEEGEFQGGLATEKKVKAATRRDGGGGGFFEAHKKISPYFAKTKGLQARLGGDGKGQKKKQR